MLKQQARLVAIFLYLTDMAMTVLSFLLAYLIRHHYLTGFELYPLYPIERYLWLLLVIVPAWTVLLFHYKAYRSFRTTTILDEFKMLLKVILIGGIFIGTIAFTFKSQYLSRTFIFLFTLINLILITGERFSIRLFSHFVRKRGYNYRNVLIVGTGKLAESVSDKIERNKIWGLNILGFVTDNPEDNPGHINDHRVIGNINELQEIINREIVDEVIFAIPRRKRIEQLEDMLFSFEDQGIKTRLVVNLFPHISARLHLEELENIHLLTFTTTPTNVLALTVKRVFDMVVSAILLVILSPIMATTALLIKCTSPCPVIFKQKRCSLNGRVFTIYKFRSMFLDAEEKKKELEIFNEMEGPVFKIKNDPRVTKIGRFIRRTNIDELPQLWNVFKGDMSIVGPRPPVPEEVAKYKRWQKRRLSMRPGLTCLWQISGRSKIKGFNEWVKMDLQYIDMWSLKLDMMIFLKTIPIVLFRRGAE